MKLYSQLLLVLISTLCSVQIVDASVFYTKQINYVDSVIQADAMSVEQGSIINYFEHLCLHTQQQFQKKVILLGTRKTSLFARDRFSTHTKTEDDLVFSLESSVEFSNRKNGLQDFYRSLIFMTGLLYSSFIFNSDNQKRFDVGKYSDLLPNTARHLIYKDGNLSYKNEMRSIAIQTTEVNDNVPLVETINTSSPCCFRIPQNIRALPVTYGTNVGGNLVAIGILCFTANPGAAAAIAGSVGCVGGCLESFSKDHTYFTPTQHACLNNAFTGTVADQVTAACGLGCTSAHANAAAIASVGGYSCGLVTGFLVQNCFAWCQEKKYQSIQNSTDLNE